MVALSHRHPQHGEAHNPDETLKIPIFNYSAQPPAAIKQSDGQFHGYNGQRTLERVGRAVQKIAQFVRCVHEEQLRLIRRRRGRPGSPLGFLRLPPSWETQPI